MSVKLEHDKKRFEEAMVSYGIPLSYEEDDEGRYITPDTQRAFDVYKASVESKPELRRSFERWAIKRFDFSYPRMWEFHKGHYVNSITLEEAWVVWQAAKGD